MPEDGAAGEDWIFWSDSDDYQSDIAADSNGYQPDSTADNGVASDGYPTRAPFDGEEEEEFDEGMRPLIEQWKSMRQGWWNQAGYETYWDLVKEDEAGWKRMGFRSIFDKRKKRPRSAAELPDPSPPEIDLDAVARDATRLGRPRDKQVNVRLTELGYQALREAARSYGLRPSTLARLLIHRGAIAVLADRPSEER